MDATVVVVGGGYAGTLVAKSLDDEAKVILIDPRDAFVNFSASLRALTRPDWAHNPFFDYRTLLDNGRCPHCGRLCRSSRTRGTGTGPCR